MTPAARAGFVNRGGGIAFGADHRRRGIERLCSGAWSFRLVGHFALLEVL